MKIGEDGYILKRTLEDGRMVGVVPLTFGRARINIGDECVIYDSW